MIFFEFELKRIVICMVCFLCFIGFHVYPWWFNTMYLYKTVCWCIVLAHCHVESTSQTKPLVIYKNLIPIIKSKFTGTKIWLKGSLLKKLVPDWQNQNLLIFVWHPLYASQSCYLFYNLLFIKLLASVLCIV